LARTANRRIPQPPDPTARFCSEKKRDSRTPAQRDRDRILYASAFARLAETTQVVFPDRGHVFHNRLTHSLKVAQIARRLAERLNRDQPAEVKSLGGIDADAAEAAGLAHDLGHPPFGHIAEEELDALVREAGVADGYEGNAQSFRIVTRLAGSDARDGRDRPIAGLNLSRMTLDGILKYPWAHGDPQNPAKWGYYKTEAGLFAWVRRDGQSRRRSAIAEIMDWADDVTFAIHDLLDFYCAGKIPIDRCKGRPGTAERERFIAGMFQRKPKWQSDRAKYIEALEEILRWFPFEPEERYHGSPEHRARLFDFSTGLIRHFLSSASFRLRPNPGPVDSLVRIDPEARRIAEVMKQFIWEYIIENPDLAVPQSGQRAAVRAVFGKLLEALDTQKHYFFPVTHHEAIARARSRGERVRLVADCISGMTEKEIMHLHRNLRGLG
jgi:dGTPase